jgi:DNA-binding MarR family transcriptional regulator
MECADAILETVPCVMQSLRALMRSRRGGDLSVPQFRALLFIGRSRRCSLSDVALHVGITLPAMSKLIDSLVGRNLVARAPEADDRRRLALSLTFEGKALVELVRTETQSFLADVFAEVTPEERAVVVQAMNCLAPLFAARKLPKEAA